MARPTEPRLNFIKGQYGANWKKIREENGFTVREVEKKTGISISQISKIENEKNPPTISQVNIYQEFFDVSLDFLTGRTDTYRIDLQEMCYYTGLEQETIKSFHRLNNLEYKYRSDKSKSPIMKEFNLFMQSEPFKNYVYQLILLKTQYNQLYTIKKELSEILTYDKASPLTMEQNFLKEVYLIGFDPLNTIGADKDIYNKCKKYIELEKNYKYSVFTIQQAIMDYIKIYEERMNAEFDK